MPTYYRPGKRRGNAGYVIRGRICGAERELRTESTDRKAAERAWHRFVVEVEAEAERDARDAIERRPDHATVSDAIRFYAASKDVTPHMARHLGRIEEHIGGVKLSDITVPDIHNAARALYPDNKPQSWETSVVAPMRAVLHWAADAKMMPYMRIRGFKPEGVRRVVTEPADGLEIAARCDEPLASFIYVTCLTGWRVSEVLILERALFDFGRCNVTRYRPKTRDWITQPILEEVRDRIAAQPIRPDGRVFKYRSRWTLYRAIDDRGIDWRPHQSRRGIATMLHQLGADARGIADAVGWVNPATVQTYIRTNHDHVRSILKKLRSE